VLAMRKNTKRPKPKDAAITIIVDGVSMTVEEFLRYLNKNSPPIPTITVIDDGKGMTMDELVRYVKTDPIHYAEIVNELAQFLADRVGTDPRKVSKRPRISVNLVDKEIELDGKVYSGIDHVHLFIVNELVKARGNWKSRAEMRKDQPRLKMEERIDLAIKVFKKKCPAIGRHIESSTRGNRLEPSLFS
jgi:hypothetical protein